MLYLISSTVWKSCSTTEWVDKHTIWHQTRRRDSVWLWSWLHTTGNRSPKMQGRILERISAHLSEINLVHEILMQNNFKRQEYINIVICRLVSWLEITKIHFRPTTLRIENKTNSTFIGILWIKVFQDSITTWLEVFLARFWSVYFVNNAWLD